MDDLWIRYVAPSVIAGGFGIFGALLTAKITKMAESRKEKTEYKVRLEMWEREFAERYVDIQLKNPKQANMIRMQFAKAFILLHGNDRGMCKERFYIHDGARLVLGRDPDCDICIQEATLSRHSALFQMKDGILTLLDIGSHNGIFINGTRIKAYNKLVNGDNITIGDQEFTVHTLRTDAPTLLPR